MAVSPVLRLFGHLAQLGVSLCEARSQLRCLCEEGRTLHLVASGFEPESTPEVRCWIGGIPLEYEPEGRFSLARAGGRFRERQAQPVMSFREVRTERHRLQQLADGLGGILLIYMVLIYMVLRSLDEDHGSSGMKRVCSSRINRGTAYTNIMLADQRERFCTHVDVDAKTKPEGDSD